MLPVRRPCAHQVDFPSIGQLLRNRAGRIEFVFEPLLVEELELGVEPVRGGGQGHTPGAAAPVESAAWAVAYDSARCYLADGCSSLVVMSPRRMARMCPQKCLHWDMPCH
jgi:hypothetical protein